MNNLFTSEKLLNEALTHNSAVYENPNLYKKSNQRLEFLGDSVLNLVISNYLFKELADDQEGSLSKLRAMIVREESLAKVGARLELKDKIIVGKNEKTMKINEKASVIADTVEAIIGAIFIDRGYEAANDFVLENFAVVIEKALQGNLITDYKTILQEKLQRTGEVSISYVVDQEEGPSHNKTFKISLWNNGDRLGTGIGKTKKEAEQMAAKAALEVGSVF